MCLANISDSFTMASSPKKQSVGKKALPRKSVLKTAMPPADMVFPSQVYAKASSIDASRLGKHIIALCQCVFVTIAGLDSENWGQS